MNDEPHQVKSAKTCFKPTVHDLSFYVINPCMEKPDDDDILINIMQLVNSQKYTQDNLDRPDSRLTSKSQSEISSISSRRQVWRATSALPRYQPRLEKPNPIQKRQVVKSGRLRSRLSHGPFRSYYDIPNPYNKSSFEDMCLIPVEQNEQPEFRSHTPYRQPIRRDDMMSPSASGRYFDTTNGLRVSSPRLPDTSITRKPFTAKHSIPCIKVQKIKLHQKGHHDVIDE